VEFVNALPAFQEAGTSLRSRAFALAGKEPDQRLMEAKIFFWTV
jgi:hypothetical protein